MSFFDRREGSFLEAMAFEGLDDIHLTWLSGLGSSYRMKGYFRLGVNNSRLKVSFRGVAFGGLYGGHNVSVEISKLWKKKLHEVNIDESKIEELLIEVQRRIMQGDMIVEFERIKPEGSDAHGNLTA